MAVLKANGMAVEVVDGESIIDASEELGVCFGCQEGNCGSCLTLVAEGMKNLGDYSDQESAFGVEGKERLMCQCKIKGGEVTLEIE